LSFLDNECSGEVSSQIEVLQTVYVEIPDTIICEGANYVIEPVITSNGPMSSATYNLVWQDGSTATNINANNAGQYLVTVSNSCGTDSDALTILEQPSILQDTVACNLQHQIVGTIAPNGGIWSASNPEITLSNATTLNPLVTSTTPGIYPVTFTDPICQSSLITEIEFPPYISLLLIDTTICLGTSIQVIPNAVNLDPIQANYNNPINFSWDDGYSGSTRTISADGVYSATASNECYSVTETSTITIKQCDIEVPNIFILSSTAGNNQFFVTYNGITKFNCVILNRWGNLIYEYDDPAGSWNGKTLNGNLVDEGTYFYKVNATFEGGNEVEKHGFVVLKY
jgi:hypothetical protein